MKHVITLLVGKEIPDGQAEPVKCSAPDDCTTYNSDGWNWECDKADGADEGTCIVKGLMNQAVLEFEVPVIDVSVDEIAAKAIDLIDS